MTDTPSKAAIKEALRLMNEYETRGVVVWTEEDANLMIVRVLALRLDFEDRVAREAVTLIDGDCPFAAVEHLGSLMLPDPVDPDEELAREKIMAIWSDGTPDRERVIAVFAEALREQGRLTDAK